MIFNIVKALNDYASATKIEKERFNFNSGIFNGNILQNEILSSNDYSKYNMLGSPNSVLSYRDAINEISKSYVGLNANQTAVKAAQDGYSESIVKGILRTNKFTKAQREAAITTDDYKNVMRKAGDCVDQASNKIDGYTKMSQKLTSVLKGIGSALVSSLISAGISLLINLIIKGIDELNKSVEEIQERIDELNSSIENLNSELDELNSRDRDSLSKSEKARLQYLEDRIAREERLLEIEKERQNREKTEKNADSFFSDEDSYFYKARKDHGVDWKDLLFLISPQLSQIDTFTDIAKGGSSDDINVLSFNTQKYLDKYNSDNPQNEIEILRQQQEGLNQESLKYVQIQEEINKLNGMVDETDRGNMEDQLMQWESKIYEYKSYMEELDSIINNSATSSTTRENAKFWKNYYENELNVAQNFYNQLNELLDSPIETLNALDEKLNNISVGQLEHFFSEEELILLNQQVLDPETTITELLILLKELQATADENPIDIHASLKSELEELGKGGNVNLLLRPKVDTSELNDKGWDAGEGIATVHSATYSNEDDTTAVNFTPIIVDPETGAYIGTLTPDELQTYAEEVIAGTKEDYLNLQIGAEFTGEDAIVQAEEAASRISKLHEKFYIDDKVIWSGFSENQTTLVDDFQSQIKTLKDALEQVKSGDIDAGVILDLQQEFPELQGESENLEQAIQDLIDDALLELLDSLGTDVPNDIANELREIANEASGLTPVLKEAFPNVQSSYEVLHDFKDAMSEGMTDEVLSSVSSLSEDLNILVAGYYAGAVSADELYTALEEHYKDDLKTYGDALIAKNEVNESFYNAVGMMSEDVTSQFSKDYGVDISNCKTYAESKLKIEQELLTAVSSMWSKYYDTQTGIFNDDFFENQLKSANSIVKTPTSLEEANNFNYEEQNKLIQQQNANRVAAIQREWDAAKEMVLKYEAAIDGLNNIVYNGIEANFDGISSTLDKNAESASDAANDAKETFDWIETAISRIQRAITNLGKTVSATYKKWATRNDALAQEFAAVIDEIELQKKAYDAYMAKAESIGLSESYKELVRNGGLKIEDITDETLKEQIQNYQEWYNKALECSDAVQDLEANLAELAKTKFDNLASEFDNTLSLIEHRAAMIEGLVEQVEAKGYIVSKEYYENLKQIEKNNRDTLIKEHDALSAALEEALNNGSIEKYSQDWYDMVGQINDVEKAIQDSDKALIEFDNTMRELDWELFDKGQERISELISESEFLANLISNQKMFNEDGSRTEYGTATMGLHAVNYNTYMAQADEYAKELQSVNEQLAEDPNNQTLLERRNELLESHREAILAAQDEKQAMKDLVSEGYDLQLSYLQELIDKRKEALQAEKDLYDYSKNVSEQTKNIANLRKQLLSLEGDTSEENKAKIQQLKVSLEEAEDELEQTEYDKWISDQERLMDDVYSEYEEILNARLDNLDGLVEGVINQTNASAEGIKETLTTETEKVGTTLSSAMNEIWSTNGSGVGNVVSSYYGAFTTACSVGGVIYGILENTKNMATVLSELAKGEIAEIAEVTVENQESGTASGTGNTSGSTAGSSSGNTGSNSSSGSGTFGSSIANSSTSTTSSSKNSSWGSWFVYKKNSYPQDKLDIDTAIQDRLKYHDFDESFAMRKSYYSAMGGTGTYTGSATQNKWMIAEMKKNGYAKGGTIGSLIKASGEDGMAFVRKGEGIIPVSMMGDWKQLIANLEPLNQSIDYLQKAVIPNTNSVTPGNMTLLIDGINMYEVNDPEQFTKNLVQAMNTSRIQKIMQDSTLGIASGKNSLTRLKR